MVSNINERKQALKLLLHTCALQPFSTLFGSLGYEMKCSINALRGIFKAISNIYDGAFIKVKENKNSSGLKAVNYFFKIAPA